MAWDESVFRETTETAVVGFSYRCRHVQRRNATARDLEIEKGRKDFVEKVILEWRRRSSGTTLRIVEGAATRETGPGSGIMCSEKLKPESDSC